MQKKLGMLLILASLVVLALVAAFVFNLGFWLKPPHEKLATAWQDDVRLLEQSQKLPKQWADIREISVKGDNSPVLTWLPKIKAPIQTHEKGRYRLDVFFVHWIEGYRYGVVVQYNLVDLGNSNTIWELGRTYKLGLVY